MKPVAYWKCIKCGALHLQKINASACCADADRAYVCTICESEHPSRISATTCCSEAQPRVAPMYYRIGRPPKRSRVLVKLEDRGRERLLIALQDYDIEDPATYWKSPKIKEGDVVDIIGACSIAGCEENDPRMSDGGPTIIILPTVMKTRHVKQEEK